MTSMVGVEKAMGADSLDRNLENMMKTELIVLVLVVGISLLLSYPMMLLWNSCLVPATTVLNEVSWLQMWGIMVLFDVIFKTRKTSKEE